MSLVLLMGCASAKTVSTQPFEDFRDSVAELKLQADAAIAIEQEQVYARYVEMWKAEGQLDQLVLQGTQNPFSMQLDEAPLFRDIQRARENLGAINDLVLQYAATMVVLTGSGDESPAVDAGALANNLRTSVDSLADTLGVDNQVADGLFFGFGEIAKVYVEKKRQDVLIELIRNSQPAIDSFAQFARQPILVSGNGIQKEYLDAVSKLKEGFGTMSESQREAVIEEMLALNDQTLWQLDSLRLIDAAYRALPDAHRKLEESVRSGTTPSFSEILTYAESLKKRYDQFTKE